MTIRITDKHLDALCSRLNAITGSPAEPYTRDAEGRLRANVGNYHISAAYGGVCLHRMSNENGGIRAPLLSGHVSKRALFDAMHDYITGMEAAKGVQA